MTQFAPINKIPVPDRHEPEIVDWLNAAGDPYTSWIWGSPAAARDALVRSLELRGSEFHRDRITVLLDDGGPVGAYCAMPGPELSYCRRFDLLQFLTLLPPEKLNRVRTETGAFRDIFQGYTTGEFVLSRMAVSPLHRRRGFGALILRRVVEIARGKGFQKLRLSVSADNAAALALYRGLGFTSVREAISPDRAIHYIGMERVLS